MLDASSFAKALSQLRRSVELCDSPRVRNVAELQTQMRAGAIQAFEYTYELAIKMLRRQLEDMESKSVDQLPFRDLLRLGAEKGLIDDPVAWFRFREKRNITAHSYDEAQAQLIFDILPDFVFHAHHLLAAIERLNPCI